MPFELPYLTDTGNPLWTGPKADDERQMVQAQAETTFRRYLKSDGSRSSVSIGPLHEENARILGSTLMRRGSQGVLFARHDGHNLVSDPAALLAYIDDQGAVAKPIALSSQVRALVQHANGDMDSLGVLWVQVDGQRCPIISTELRSEGDKQQFRDITVLVLDPTQRPAMASDGTLSFPATWLNGEPVTLTSMEDRVLRAAGCEGDWTNGHGSFFISLTVSKTGEPQITLTMTKCPHLLFNGGRFTCKNYANTEITLVIPPNCAGGITVKAPKNSMSGNDKNNGHGGDMETMGTVSRGRVGQLNALPIYGHNRRAGKSESERLSVTHDYVINSCESERLGAMHHQDLPTALLIGGWMLVRGGFLVLPEVAFNPVSLSQLALITLLRTHVAQVRPDTFLAVPLTAVLNTLIEKLTANVSSENAALWESIRFVGVGSCTSEIEPPLSYAEILLWRTRKKLGTSELAKSTLAKDGLIPVHRMVTGPFLSEDACTTKKQAEDGLIQAEIEELMLGHSVSHMMSRLVENLLSA